MTSPVCYSSNTPWRVHRKGSHPNEFCFRQSENHPPRREARQTDHGGRHDHLRRRRRHQAGPTPLVHPQGVRDPAQVGAGELAPPGRRSATPLDARGSEGRTGAAHRSTRPASAQGQAEGRPGRKGAFIPAQQPA